MVRKRIKSAEEVVKPISDFEKVAVFFFCGTFQVKSMRTIKIICFQENSVFNDQKLTQSADAVALNSTAHIPYGIPCVRELLRLVHKITDCYF